ncbi:uncharacterized protein LOC112458630 [Temnothorax curvispinosus]|uniref:Uncharacterized protein LOC112458630 n=1 Tax=Temnothorax curvispinosus TaxID=300111 RepID=A0A6J1Q7D3_9HYME|nr:uncharacterized protein LOC112458630 [Temnothorax curvispinosus]
MYIPECTDGCNAVGQDNNRIQTLIKFSSRNDRDLLISSWRNIKHALLTEIIDLPETIVLAEPGLKGRAIPVISESETVAPIRYGPGSYDVAKRDWRDQGGRRRPRSFGRKTGAAVVVMEAAAVKVKGDTIARRS